MPGNSIGTAFVDVAFDPKQISGQIGGLGGKVEGGFKKMGGMWGVAAAAGFGAAITAGVAAGKYLYDVGKQFDDMADTIRVSTGKTGKELEALSNTAKKVGTDVPASFEDAGKAVSVLSTRLELTGKPLRTVSDQMLELSRLSGVDLSEALNSVTRMLGDAGLKGADASKGIDELWRAAQATQVPITRLSDLLTKFGGPMRQLGFSFEEQAALLGKFEKEGVNTELVMGSMRIALGKMAKAGKEPVTELRKTMQAIRDTGDAGKANALAIQLFGARAGPDMAAAIREGRFSIDDLVKTIKTGKDTVLAASKDTRDFSEQWQLFKNRVAVAVAPAAEKMFAAIGEGMERISDNLPAFIEFVQQSKALKDLGKTGKDLAPTFKPLGKIFAGLAPALKDLGPMLEDLGAIVRDLTPLWKVLGAIIVANVKIWAEQIKGFLIILEGVVKVVRGLLEGDWSMAWQGAKKVVEGLVTSATAQLRVIVGVVQQVAGLVKGPAIAIGKAILDGIMAGVSPLVGFVTGAFNSVRSAITSAVGGITSAAQAVGRGITTGVQTVIAGLAAIVTGVFNAVRSAIASATGAISSAAQAVGRAIVTGVQQGVATIASIVTAAFNAVRTAITSSTTAASAAARAVGTAIVNGVKAGLATIGSAVASLMAQAVSAVRNVAGAAAGAASAVGQAIVNGIRQGLSGVYAAVKGGLDRTWAAISAVAGAAGRAAVAIGTAIIGGIVSGLSGLIGAVGSKIASSVGGAISWAKGHVGSTVEEHSKKELGDPIPVGIIAGVVAGTADVGDAIAKSVGTAIEKGRASVEAGRSAFSESWGRLGSDVLTAFDGITASLKTKSEKLLDAMELKKRMDEIRSAVSQARTDLAAAQAEQAALAPQEGESDADFQARAAAAAEKVKQAQAALNAALYEQQRQALEQRAAQERVNLDARLALQRRHLEDALAAQGTAFAKGKINAETAQKNVLALMNRYGIDYKKAGLNLGTAFTTQLKESLDKSVGAIEALLRRIRQAIEGVTAANNALKSSAGTRAAAPAPPPATAAAGVLGAAPTAQATTYGGGTMYGRQSPFAGVERALASSRAMPRLEPSPTMVRVYIGDEELRGIVRTEVGYMDDATARVVLAGAR